MKACTKCGAIKDFGAFYRQTMNSKDGFQSHCKVCDNARVAARKAANPERARITQATSDRNKYMAKKATINARNKLWKENNPAALQAADGRRRAAKLLRTPKWVGADEIWLVSQAYDIAALRTKVLGFSWHVDHILPLQGKKVSGLHVVNNLQVIPARDNMRKSNSFATS